MPGLASSVTLAVPAGTVEGDLMIVALALSFSDGPADPALPVVTVPTGWTEVLADYPGGTLSWGDLGAGNEEIRLGIYSRVASSAELASYDWDWSSGGVATPYAALIKNFPAAVPGVVPSITAAATTVRTIAATLANPIDVESPSLAPTQSGTKLVTFFVARNGLYPAPGGTTFAVPAGQTDLTPAVNLQTDGTLVDPTLPLGLGVFLESRPFAGPTGIRTSSCDIDVGATNPFQGMGYAIVIKGCGGTIPEPVPPPPQELAAIRFAGSEAGAWIDTLIGGLGIGDCQIELYAYLEDSIENAALVQNGNHDNGRNIFIQYDNAGLDFTLAVADSQSLFSQAPDWIADPPPLGVWLYLTLRTTATTPGGTLIASWTLAETAGTTFYASKTNEVEDSVTAGQFALNGSGSVDHGLGLGFTWRCQYVRAQTGYKNDADTIADWQSIDTTGWAFWWAFEDDGFGGVSCVDKTGNGLTPTIVNGTLTVGPNIPVVP